MADAGRSPHLMPDLKKPLSARFTNALAFAANIHRLQARKGTQVPYMAHILGVASIALEHGANEEEAIAAVLLMRLRTPR